MKLESLGGGHATACPVRPFAASGSGSATVERIEA